MNKDARILVTGAAGFIGGWITESSYARGYTNVRAGVRKWAGAARIARFPVDIVLCDVMKPADVARAMEGVDVVVHCAIGSKEVNVKGTEHLLDAALKAGVRRFVHFSTVDVYGTAEGQIGESTPFQHTGSDYGDSKIEAEGLCARYHELGLPVVIFRPSIVYGPYCKLWISKFAERLSSGNWGTFEKIGEGTCNLIYIEDLIDAIFLAMNDEKAVGQTFNLNGPEMITWNEYFRRLNAALGLPPLRVIGFGTSKLRTRVMTPLKSAARFVMNNYGETVKALYRKSAIVQRFMKGTEQSMKTTPGPGELSMFGRKPAFDIAKITSLLGFRPRFGVDKGIDLSTRWYAHESGITHELIASRWNTRQQQPLRRQPESQA